MELCSSPLLALSKTAAYTLQDHKYTATASLVITMYTCGGMGRLRWPGWMVTYWDVYPPANGHGPDTHSNYVDHEI